jgi:hypothetical protein
VKNHFLSSAFTYVPTNKVLISEASSLGLKPGAIPTAITIVSARTGIEASFTLDYIEEDGSLRFEAWNPTIKATGLEVHILND